MARGHGGRRIPGNPAPVSGPGALSARTDGGPADTQPMRVASGGPYGSRQALEGLQQAAPLAAGTSSPAPGGQAGSPPPAAGAGGSPLSAPGTQPLVSPAPRRIVPQDPDVLLRALYRLYPHPDIARLLPEGG